ncbi:MAG: hypothetical protein KKB50_08820 [Planctomycetes bacterium]|nr:hypothetical protein [Planctomycetota bacterium]
MLEIRWTEEPEQFESLAVCLKSLLAGQDRDVPYDELVTVLGLGCATVAVPDECLAWWWTYARDAALPTAAALYGLRLRPLHPREAAAGLETAAEYADHFRDSYVPLVLAALAHGQPALVWGGWPEPLNRFWGVIASAQKTSLSGFTIRSDGQPHKLTAPALLVYVVEDHQPDDSAEEPAVLFTHAARVAVQHWRGEPTTLPNVAIGEQAYDVWQERLAADEPCPVCADSSARCQSQMMHVRVSARRHLTAWLRRTARELDQPQREQAARWASACERVAERLQPYTHSQAIQALLSSPTGRAELRQAVADTRAIESEAVRALRPE